jgi:hypothetical protein
MKFLIYLLELFIIVYYIDQTYGTTNYTSIQSSNANYSSYSYIDVVDNQILNLKNAPENIKFDIWKNSNIPEEVLSYFPHMEIMQEVYNDRVEDNGSFKKIFFNYMQDLQFDYQSGDIDNLQFKNNFLSPPDNLKNKY